MKDEIPVHTRQFRVPFEHMQTLNEYVDELLAKGAIEVSTSPYNSPIFCVTKKARPEADPNEPLPLRVVLDYRGINAKSIPDRYCMREVRECIDEIGRAKATVFRLDLGLLAAGSAPGREEVHGVLAAGQGDQVPVDCHEYGPSKQSQ